MTALTHQERRLGGFALLLGAALAVAGGGRLLWPAGAGLDGAGLLGAAACLGMVALDPRRSRPLVLPPTITFAAACGLAAAQGVGGEALLWGMLAVLSGVLLAQARRSVCGSWLRGGPPV